MAYVRTSNPCTHAEFSKYPPIIPEHRSLVHLGNPHPLTRLLCPHLEFVSQTFYFLVTEYVGDKNLSDFMVRVVYASKCVCRTDSVHGLVVKL